MSGCAAVHYWLVGALLVSCTALDPSGHSPLDGGASEPDPLAGRARDAGFGADANRAARLDGAEPAPDATAPGPDSEAPSDDAGGESHDAAQTSLCSASQRDCNAACIPSDSCCSEADCAEGAACDAGTCACPSGTHVCRETCVPDTDVASCGKACDPCTAPTGGSVACVAAACVPSCPAGQRSCAGQCISNSMSCTGQCPANTHDCSGVCIANDSVAGCGANSCTPCPLPAHGSATCDGSRCGFSCEPNFKRCGSTCIANAACCGNADCQANATCAAGNACACSSGFKPCGNSCIPSGQCCNAADCQANATCSAGVCDCVNGFKACDGACIAQSACCGDSECSAGMVCIASKCTGWCGAQTPPAGVAAADYSCLDFEQSLPAMWVNSDAAGVGTTMVRASSRPSSLRTAGNGNKAMLTWSITGSTPISSITFTAQVSPDAHPSIAPQPYYADLVCITIGYTRACLTYSFKGQIRPQSGPLLDYTGLFVNWGTFNPNGASFTFDCPMNASSGAALNLASGVWNPMVFTATRGGQGVDLSISGQTANCVTGFDADTNAEVSFGVTPSFDWAVGYDSVNVAVKR